MTKAKEKTVRIGGASGFWGDSSVAVPQLVFGAEIDYLVFDYLAETTMAILAAARGKKPELGYATDFVDSAMKSMLPEIANISNIGVIARKPEYLPIILAQLMPAEVKAYFSHMVRGEVKRYLVPGIDACNVLLFDALDGGGPASMRMDPLGKGMGQMLLDIPIHVPRDLRLGDS